MKQPSRKRESRGGCRLRTRHEKRRPEDGPPFRSVRVDRAYLTLIFSLPFCIAAPGDDLDLLALGLALGLDLDPLADLDRPAWTFLITTFFGTLTNRLLDLSLTTTFFRVAVPPFRTVIPAFAFLPAFSLRFFSFTLMLATRPLPATPVHAAEPESWTVSVGLVGVPSVSRVPSSNEPEYANESVVHLRQDVVPGPAGRQVDRDLLVDQEEALVLARDLQVEVADRRIGGQLGDVEDKLAFRAEYARWCRCRLRCRRRRRRPSASPGR